MKIVKPYVKLIHHTQSPEAVIECAGRVCYKSEDKITDISAAGFVENLIGMHHDSVLEHASVGFMIGTDRGVSHELVRHRLASYSQSSTRYCNYGAGKFGGEITVVKPFEIPDEGPLFETWVTACEYAEFAYMQMLEDGAKPQTARSILPTCLFTKIVMTANLREYRHFVKLRTSDAAHPDMRIIADEILNQLKVIAPTVFQDL